MERKRLFSLGICILTCFLLGLCTSCKKGNYHYDASGVLEATEIVVSAQANGEIQTFNIQEGDPILKDQIVGYIDTLQLHLQKQLLILGRVATLSKKPNKNKQIASIQAALDHAKKEEARLVMLKKDEAATQKQIDDIRAQIQQLQAQLSAQISTIENNISGLNAESSVQDIQIAQIEDFINKSLLKSPINGFVIQKYAQAGEQTAQGRPLMKVADISSMNMRAYVSASQLSQLKIGQKVKVYALSNNEYKAFNGKITWISEQAEFTPKTIQTKEERTNLVYAVKIAIPNQSLLLKSGMYADVAF